MFNYLSVEFKPIAEAPNRDWVIMAEFKLTGEIEERGRFANKAAATRAFNKNK